MQVIEIMAKSPALCLTDTPLGEVARMMVEHDCGAIPVVESRDAPRPVGVITDRDIVVRVIAQGRNPLEATASEGMTNGVATVTPAMSLEECATVMEEHQVRRVPVVDEEGKVIGIVSQADIVLNASSQEAANVVREISEEEDSTPISGDYAG